jgi:hypothetical protein
MTGKMGHSKASSGQPAATCPKDSVTFTELARRTGTVHIKRVIWKIMYCSDWLYVERLPDQSNVHSMVQAPKKVFPPPLSISLTIIS